MGSLFRRKSTEEPNALKRRYFLAAWAVGLVLLACGSSSTGGPSGSTASLQRQVGPGGYTTRTQIAMTLYEALRRGDFTPLEAHIPSVDEIRTQNSKFTPEARQIWHALLTESFQATLLSGSKDYRIDWSRIVYRGASAYGPQCTLVFDFNGQPFTVVIDDCKWMPGRGWTLGDYFKGVRSGVQGTLIDPNAPDNPQDARSSR